MYIVDIKRIATGKFLGSLSDIPAAELATPIIKYFLNNYKFLSTKVDKVIIGNVLSAGSGMNLARIISIKSGLSFKTSAFTVNHVCGSGLTSIIQAYQSILLNHDNIVISGGVESMSNAPYLLPSYRTGVKFGNKNITDSIYNDGLFCSLSNSLMGITAENIASKYKISRERQDIFSLNSHSRANKAIDLDFFKKEIVPINAKNNSEFYTDEQPRKDTNFNKLALLNPIFKHKGTVTAGNSSSLNDGAALAILASEKAVNKYHLNPMARIVGYNFIGLDPKFMGLGPFFSIDALLSQQKIPINYIDLFEINEAFASTTLAVIDLLKIDPNKVNINGGAIALGHPLGASGAKILASLVYNLIRTKSKYGIASLCIGGGQGVSMLIERL